MKLKEARDQCTFAGFFHINIDIQYNNKLKNDNHQPLKI